MITTAAEATIIMATIFGKSNNDNKTEVFLAEVNHFKLLDVATTKLSQASVGY